MGILIRNVYSLTKSQPFMTSPFPSWNMNPISGFKIFLYLTVMEPWSYGNPLKEFYQEFYNFLKDKFSGNCLCFVTFHKILIKITRRKSNCPEWQILTTKMELVNWISLNSAIGDISMIATFVTIFNVPDKFHNCEMKIQIEAFTLSFLPWRRLISKIVWSSSWPI